MLRGAYEAIYLGKPVLMSNWDVLKNNFPIGAVLVDNTVKGITDGIKESLSKLNELSQDAKLLRKKKIEIWNKKRNI